VQRSEWYSNIFRRSYEQIAIEVGTGYLDERFCADVGGGAGGSRFAYRMAEVDGGARCLGQRQLRKPLDRGRRRVNFLVAFRCDGERCRRFGLGRR
jgi:hypothetical protein